MLGKNIVQNEVSDPDGRIKVHSIFHTIQGEGPDAGRPAVFIRLAHCNLRCWFCDTDFDHGQFQTVASVVYEVERLCVANSHTTDLVVITGGEPLIQNNLGALVKELLDASYYVSVETAGTVWNPAIGVHAQNRDFKFIVSPKTRSINSKIASLAVFYKYIIRAGHVDPEDGLPFDNTQFNVTTAFADNVTPRRLHRPSSSHDRLGIFVQPMDQGDPELNALNLQAAVASCLKFGYRLSIQQHKIAQLP